MEAAYKWTLAGVGGAVLAEASRQRLQPAFPPFLPASIQPAVHAMLERIAEMGGLSLAAHSVLAYTMHKLVLRLLRSSTEEVVGALLRVVVVGMRSNPLTSGVVSSEFAKIEGKLEEMLTKDTRKMGEAVTNLPDAGMEVEEVLARMKEYRGAQVAFDDKKAFGGIYADDALAHLTTEAYAVFAESNGLYPGVFPAVRKFEAEVVQMSMSVLGGDKECCGVMTSGGTESIFLAMKSYRSEAREKGIEHAEIVAPSSVHPAFDKACDILGMKLKKVEVGSDLRAHVKNMKKAMTARTIALVGSAPSFPHGVLDPIAMLAEIAKASGVGLHVDACYGGFLLPFLRKEGRIREDFDLRVSGVTSISADLHKYGMAPKGSSVLLWRGRERRRRHFFVCTDWSGGLYASPGFRGSHPGGVVAGTWAAMVGTGREGYTRAAMVAQQSLDDIRQYIEGIDGLEVLGEKEHSSLGVLAFNSVHPSLPILEVADEMEKKGWAVTRLQRPACMQVQAALRQGSTFASAFAADLKVAVEVVKKNKKEGKQEEGLAGIYGLAGTLPDRQTVGDILYSYLDSLYKL